MAAAGGTESAQGWRIVTPPFVYALLMLAIPLLTILAYSFFQDGYQVVIRTFTLENYRAVWSDPIFRTLMLRSLGVAGLVTIAAAPDFTRRMEGEFSDADRADLAGKGFVTRPSDYEGGDYVFSRRLFDQGAENLVLAEPLTLPMPVRMLQGTADVDVPMSEALRLLDHATGPDIRLTLVRDADHRFSGPPQLQLMLSAIAEVASGPDA